MKITIDDIIKNELTGMCGYPNDNVYYLLIEYLKGVAYYVHTVGCHPIEGLRDFFNAYTELDSEETEQSNIANKIANTKQIPQENMKFIATEKENERLEWALSEPCFAVLWYAHEHNKNIKETLKDLNQYRGWETLACVGRMMGMFDPAENADILESYMSDYLLDE